MKKKIFNRIIILLWMMGMAACTVCTSTIADGCTYIAEP